MNMEYYYIKKKTTVTFLKIVSQNAPDCIAAHTHFKTFWGGAYPRTPLGSSWPSLRPLGTSPPHDKS